MAINAQRICDRCDALGRLSELPDGLTRVFLSPAAARRQRARARLDGRGRHGHAHRRDRQLSSAATKASARGCRASCWARTSTPCATPASTTGCWAWSARSSAWPTLHARRRCGCRSRSRSSASATRKACASGPRCSAAARSPARSIRRCSTRPTQDGATMRDALRGVRPRSGAYRRRRAAARRRARVRRAPHRAGARARGRRPAGRRGHRDQRRQSLQRRGHRHGRSRGHRADGPAPRRARRGRGMRAGGRAHRPRHAGSRRHRGPDRGAAGRDQRDSRQGPFHARRPRAGRRIARTRRSPRCAREFEAIAARRDVDDRGRAALGGAAPRRARRRCSGSSPRRSHAEGVRVHHLPSGAGHDGMAIIDIAPIGMLFVRCKGGISHNPAEAVTLDDVGHRARACSRASSPQFAPPASELTSADATDDPRLPRRASRRRGGASSPSWCACRRTIRPATARRTRSARRELLEAMGFAVERHAVPPERGRAPTAWSAAPTSSCACASAAAAGR